MPPASRTDLKEYCLRRLGKPVITINVDDDQVEDRIDDALQFFAQYHFDGVERMYLKHLVTSGDVSNTYITVPEPVIAVMRVYPITSLPSAGMFDVRYQMFLNDVYSFSSVEMLHYTMVQSHLRMVEMLLVGEQQIRFNRHQNRIYIDAVWGSDINAGDYLVFDCYRQLDPDTFTDVYNDMFLKRYATALLKRQWGENLMKFKGAKLPGGIELNGGEIFEAALKEIEKLEEEMQSRWELPPEFQVG